MRKLTHITLVICCLLLAISPITLAGPDPLQLRFFVDQTRYVFAGSICDMDVAPIVRDDRVLLPIRYIAGVIGASVTWDPSARKATIDMDTRTIELWIDRPTAHVDGRPVPIDLSNRSVCPIIHRGRTMLPLRFVSESLGAEVTWDSSTRTAGITLPPGPAPAFEQQLLRLVNRERISAGLPALSPHDGLNSLARLKSLDLITQDYFAHQSPTYGSPFDMMDLAGIKYRSAGENLAAAPTVDQAHSGLMDSPGHRDNILNESFTHIGIGIMRGGPCGLMFTQMFIGQPR